MSSVGGPYSESKSARASRARSQGEAAAAQVVAELRRMTGQVTAQVTADKPGALPRRGALIGKSALQQVGQGLLQPMHAAALLGQDRELLGQALLPALLLLAFCLGVGFLQALSSPEPGLLWPMLESGLKSFAVLAPVPSIVMANHYGRLCARAHERMQLGSCQPRLRPLWRSGMFALRQVVVVAVALAPLSFAAHLLPWVGSFVAKGLLLLWALHWIVVEALDDGCVDAAVPRETAGLPALALPLSGPWIPWFLWPVQRAGTLLPGLLGAPLRWFVRQACWLCSPWRKEITLIEQNLPVMLGFAVTTAVLLCTPVLNLLFRPITVVAAVRLIGVLGRPELPAPSAPLMPPAEPGPVPSQGSC